MQHYRLPTRLLDWTESPLIAAFFASEVCKCHDKFPETIEDPDGALFALSPYKLNELKADADRLFMPEDDLAKQLIAPAFDRDAVETAKVIAIRPAEVDVRLMVQLSEFTLNGYNSALENLTRTGEFLMKFRIPSESKLEMRKELKRLGVRLSSIFPDLEHLAEEIRQLAFKQGEMPADEDPPKDDPAFGKLSVWGGVPADGGERST